MDVLLCCVLLVLCLCLLLWRWKNRQAVSPDSFACMPGPVSYPVLGTTYLYMQGKYSWDRIHHMGLSKYEEFGPVVREQLLPGVNIVWLFHPRDIQTMYRTEGAYPSRRSHTAILQLRKSQPSLYNTGGLLPTNGPEWEKIRKPLQKPIMSAVAASNFIPSIDDVMKDAVRYIHENLDNFSNRDFLDELEKIFTEATGVVTLDHRFNCLQFNLNPESTPARLNKAAERTNSNVLGTDNGFPWWKFFQTKSYKEIKESQSFIARVARKFVGVKIDNMELELNNCEGKKTLLEHWLTAEGLEANDVATGVEDFLLAGIHTSAYTMAFLLYHLATNPQAQDKLQQECVRVLEESGGNITKKTLTSAKYAAAVLKESLRLNPISVGAGRILSEDAVFGGFQVPKGTVLVSQNQVACRLGLFFENPNNFDPERWLPGSKATEVDNFLVLPFGYGPRGCIGKSIAESSMLLFIIRFFSQFSITWEGGALDCQTLLINKPDAPLFFKIDSLYS